MDTELHGSPSYYSVLGVNSDSSIAEIKQAYRRLAMQWHPDRWTRTPSLLTQAKLKFQQIQEAYSVLSDEKKRALYDIGLYNPAEEDDEGYSDFVQEMVSLIAQERRQNKTYNMDELQTMFAEMVQGFQQFPSMPFHYDSSAALYEYSTSRDSEYENDGTWSFAV